MKTYTIMLFYIHTLYKVHTCIGPLTRKQDVIEEEDEGIIKAPDQPPPLSTCMILSLLHTQERKARALTQLIGRENFLTLGLNWVIEALRLRSGRR